MQACLGVFDGKDHDRLHICGYCGEAYDESLIKYNERRLPVCPFCRTRIRKNGVPQLQ